LQGLVEELGRRTTEEKSRNVELTEGVAMLKELNEHLVDRVNSLEEGSRKLRARLGGGGGAQ